MRKCLICKERKIEHYGICPACKIINDNMLNLHADLRGYTAVVTGARVRIGYATALRLLREGAKVIGVTRFPHIAYEKYRNELDFESFKDRLHLIGFDLMHINVIDDLISQIEQCSPEGIDILINNAAQTIRKKPEYYVERIEMENRLILACENESKDNLPITVAPIDLSVMTQCLPVANQETDNYNSWVARSDDIDPREMLEVQLINVTAPFFLSTRLKPLMLKSKNLNKFIINVSSVEGRFNQKRKLSRHIHTNMAKASLNMMTNSMAYDYIGDRILIYSCDPGWITSQFPEDYENNKNFVPYLSAEDGACRLLYPIYMHLNDLEVKDVGMLYKDYKIMEY